MKNLFLDQVKSVIDHGPAFFIQFENPNNKS